MKKILAGILLCFASFWVNAANSHFCDCSTGSDPLCVIGADSGNGGDGQPADGTAAHPWKTLAKAVTTANAANGNDEIRLGQGCAWTTERLSQLRTTHGTRSAPIKITSYVPSWSLTGAKPIIKWTTASAIINLDSSASTISDTGGWLIENLDLEGGTTAQWGVIIAESTSDVTLNNLTINQTLGGIQCNGNLNPGKTPAGGSDGFSERLTVKNSTITNNSNGILTSCSQSLIENNQLSNNGDSALAHQIYISAPQGSINPGPSYQMIIRGNTMTNATTGADGTCVTTAFVIHDHQIGLVVENNIIKENSMPTSSQCWGLAMATGDHPSVAEQCSNCVFRGNTVINYPVGIAVDLCQYCTVENNYVYVGAFSTGNVGIRLPGKDFDALDADDVANTNDTVVNNTVYFSSPNASSIGIQVSRDGTGHIVSNNLVYFATGSTAATKCFDTSTNGTLTTDKFSYWDYNLCYYAGTTGKWDSVRTTLGTQQAAGFDVHGVNTDPVISTPNSGNNFSLAIGTTSPAKNTGSTAHYSPWSIFGIVRSSVDSTPDIGAFEYGQGSNASPESPTNVQVN